jgi:hypothetical protein
MGPPYSYESLRRFHATALSDKEVLKRARVIIGLIGKSRVRKPAAACAVFRYGRG